MIVSILGMMRDKVMLKIKPIFLFIIILLLISGCASIYPPRVQPPTSTKISDNIKSVEVRTLEVLPYPSLPPVVKAKDMTGGTLGGFYKSGLDTLVKFRKAAKTNQKTLVKTNQIIVKLTRERNDIASVAVLEEKKANFLAEKWAQSENDLKDEKFDHTVDVWGYRVLLIFMSFIAIQQ